MKSREVQDYHVFAAGHVWQVPSATLSVLPDGTEAISADELGRIHKAVANAICGQRNRLSFEELEFLCDITSSTFADAASFLGFNKSTISTWRRRGAVPSMLVGNALKRWFWFKLFGEALGTQTLPIHVLASDVSFLEAASQAALVARLSDEVELEEAS